MPLLDRFRQAYGAGPLQLVLVVAGFVLAGYAVHTLGIANLWNREVWWQSIAVWFVGAALLHDLLLYPAYAAVDRLTVALGQRRRSRSGSTADGSAPMPVVNFVRVPLMAIGLITLLFFPGVIRQGADTYNRATGQTQDPFLLRWLLLCGAIVVVAVIVYVIAARRHRRPGGHEDRSATPPPS